MRMWLIALCAIVMTVRIAAAADGPVTVAVSLVGEATETMAIKIDKTSVKAGKVTFKVTNDAKTERHELIVVRVKDPTTPLPYDTAKHRVIEDKIKALGEVSDLKPGQSKSMTLTLTAGDYLLICNVKDHYKAGMTLPFTATK
jgi:uncharacterized cupredoxin-like copper-binding protein